MCYLDMPYFKGLSVLNPKATLSRGTSIPVHYPVPLSSARVDNLESEQDVLPEYENSQFDERIDLNLVNTPGFDPQSNAVDSTANSPSSSVAEWDGESSEQCRDDNDDSQWQPGDGEEPEHLPSRLDPSSSAHDADGWVDDGRKTWIVPSTSSDVRPKDTSKDHIGEY